MASLIVIKVYILQAPTNFPSLKFPGFGFVHFVLQTNMCTNLQPWSWALISYSYELPFFVSHFCDQSVSVCHFCDQSVQKMENNWLSMIATCPPILQAWSKPERHWNVTCCKPDFDQRTKCVLTWSQCKPDCKTCPELFARVQSYSRASSTLLDFHCSLPLWAIEMI